jgi:alpha-amylase
MKHTGMNILLSALLLTGCTHTEQAADPSSGPAVSSYQMYTVNQDLQKEDSEDARAGSVYEIFPYSYYDTDGDGIGDLKGIDEKIPYLKDLGLDALWLTPVVQADSYHKYDVTDYLSIDEQFGTMEDYDQLVQDLHEEDMKILFDLVINHTSSHHPWFQKALAYLKSLKGAEPDVSVCPYMDYYNFTKDFQTGYTQIPGTDWYYESRFVSTMPDLNLDSEAVRNEIRKIISFWIDHGVDGFRLDAVTSYYTGSPEKNIAFLTWLNDTVKEMKDDAYLVGEAWTKQEEYASYYQSGIDSFFDFAFADQNGIIAQTLKNSYGAEDYMNAQVKAQELYASFSSSSIDAPFYTNHDMARSAGYYAGDKGEKTKTAIAMNLLMSGNAFLYYGEELGMKGSGKDENKRAPMQWGEEEGMCRGPEQMGTVEMKFPSLSEQKEDPASIYAYTKEVLKIRNAFSAIRDGTAIPHEDLSDEETAVYEKKDGKGSVLLVLNTSDSGEEADLSSLDYTKLSACLNTNEESITLKDGRITMPAYSIAILEKE